MTDINRISPPSKKPTFVDLFCGCGGFTLGMLRAGFDCKAAIDFNEEATDTLRNNLQDVAHVLSRDLTQFPPQKLAELIDTTSLDVIVGGPPCQGFSTARQRDGSNHGDKRLKEDKRRFLYQEFLRYVEFFKPRVFVMENVLGIRSAAGGDYFTRVQKESRLLGYRVHAQVEDAWNLGVPQKRRRQLFIGVRNDLPGYFLPNIKPATRAIPGTTLGAAIGDLPILRAGGGDNERDYDLKRRASHFEIIGKPARNYLHNVLEVDRALKLTSHVARPHSARDLRDFLLIKEGESSAIAMKRGVEFEFPYDKSSFKDRYTRQHRDRACSTIVAHLSKDGLMFIHPTQNRSITPREAARIQSFPDWFIFPRARTHAFRLIGNAVPPLIGEAVGLAVLDFLQGASTHDSQAAASAGMASHRLKPKKDRGVYFSSKKDAARELEHLAMLDRRALRALDPAAFVRGWHSILYLFPGLHPDNALDHGKGTEEIPTDQLALPGFEQSLKERYSRSGWPVALELIGREAWRRYERAEISEGMFYCAEAQRAGLVNERAGPTVSTHQLASLVS